MLASLRPTVAIRVGRLPAGCLCACFCQPEVATSSLAVKATGANRSRRDGGHELPYKRAKLAQVRLGPSALGRRTCLDLLGLGVAQAAANCY